MELGKFNPSDYNRLKESLMDIIEDETYNLFFHNDQNTTTCLMTCNFKMEQSMLANAREKRENRLIARLLPVDSHPSKMLATLNIMSTASLMPSTSDNQKNRNRKEWTTIMSNYA